MFKFFTLVQLLETIEKNGEFESYVDMLAEREDRMLKNLRKRDRDRARQAYGDRPTAEYANINSEVEEETQEEVSDWSGDTTPESSDADSGNDMVTGFADNQNGATLGFNAGNGSLLSGHGQGQEMHTPYSRSHKAKTKLSKGEQVHRFNALSFLAMNLKS